MQLEKVIIDGQVYYKEVIREQESIATGEEISPQKEDVVALWREKFERGFARAKAIVKRQTRSAREKFRGGIERLFPKCVEATNEESLVLLLPYMDEQGRSEVFRELMKRSNVIEKLSPESVLPYFNAQECDAFILFVVEHFRQGDLSTMAKFASENCLHQLVDGFIEGRYADIQIESLYPYLPKNEIKRLLTYYVEEQ